MSSETAHRPGLARVLAIALALSLALALWIWALGSERRAIHALPPAERLRLFDQTRRSLESVCKGSVDPGLRDYCQEQAAFIQQFPDCDEECAELARAALSQPPR